MQPMKNPKRKAPDRKPVRPAAAAMGPVMSAGAAVLRLAAARPGLTGGIVTFVIVFGMISANALWYQHGGHPSPLLRTRDAHDQHLLVGFQRAEEPADVTTFRIERPEPTETGSVPQPSAARPSGVAEAVQAAAVDLVRGVQQELVRLGYYQGEPDGLTGPRTAAAIVAYQKAAGLPASGEASDALLAALRKASPPSATVAAPAPPKAVKAPAVVPPARPTALPAMQASDPVAEAIRKAEKLTPPAPIPAVATPGSARTSDAKLVTDIQRGLSKFAYSNVAVDGVAGASTREAIRNFEKAYRLPETGEPNERVLKKLKDIGAL